MICDSDEHPKSQIEITKHPEKVNNDNYFLKMSAVLVNGRARLKGWIFTALGEVAKTSNENGIKTAICQFGSKPSAGYVGCFQSNKKGFCEWFKNDKFYEFIRLFNRKTLMNCFWRTSLLCR